MCIINYIWSWLFSKKSELLVVCNTLNDMDHHKTETRINFLQCLDTDVCIYIMSFLDDPADVVRASAVSCFWHHFVIANGFAKQICLKLFPQLSRIDVVVNGSTGIPSSAEAETSTAMKCENSETDHMVYASLLRAITGSKVSRKDCIEYAVSASSTDNFPDESITNTLHPRDRFIRRPSYWSSKGQSKPEVPETLVYKLRTGVWAITEIDIQPFKAFFQHGRPIYSAKSVRFRMGHPKSKREINSELQNLPLQKPVDDKFVWTYTSPEYPMIQDNVLQPFMLPEPILCIGGYLQVELMGRVQRQEIDGLFYTCICHVRVVGRPLFPAFDMAILNESSEKIMLIYYPEFFSSINLDSSVDELTHRSLLEEELLERIGLLEELLPVIQHGPLNPIVWEEEDDDADNEDGVL
ncbi:hypothetical protein ACS0TY_019923 [Phlomoides rotata]